jgi:hypothetical protein
VYGRRVHDPLDAHGDTLGDVRVSDQRRVSGVSCC